MHFSLNMPFCVTILLLSVSIIPLTTAQVAPVVIFQSPKKQTEQGLSADHVRCNDSLILMKKISDSSPACVKTQAAQKLVERGWGIIITLVMPTSCSTDQITSNGQCIPGVPSITPIQVCNGDTLIPYSYSLPCILSTPTCPIHMTYSNGKCTSAPPFIPTPPVKYDCVPSLSTICPTSSEIAYPSCNGIFNGNICQPDSASCPIGLQGYPYGATCNYNTPKCSAGYHVMQISAGSYSCQPTSSLSLSNATTYSTGQKVGVFTISIINPYNVTGYYNNPYPIGRPGFGDFIIMHVGDILNPTCDGSAPLVITSINYPNSITVSIGESSGKPFGGCPICLSANSEIKRPNGDINIKDVKDGMIVWSTNLDGMPVKSKVIKINNVFVGKIHKVIDLQLSDGRELFVSPNHPTYDSRIVADLKVGERYDGSSVKSIELVQYKYQFTYDILPDSQTGNYFANGILVGSTLK